MEKTCSAWVLCPSKNFPGQYYYFNTRTGEKAWSWTVTSGQTPNKYVTSTSEQPKAQASFGQINFPKYLHQVSSPRRNQPIQNSFIKLNAVNSLSQTPRSRETPQSRESEQIVSTTTNTNFKLAPPNFKPLQDNPFSLSFPECSQANGKQLCQETASKKKVFDPIFKFNFPSKRRSDIEIDELNHRMKKVKIESLSPKSSYTSEQGNYLQQNPNKLKADVENDKSSSSTPHHFVRNDNVKVSVHFLRNLSTSKYTEAWYLVPDVDVLMEDLTFIKEFMAGDHTCSLMIPAVVLAKLKSLRFNCFAAESRAIVAGQVFEWLTKNSVCQTDKIDECSLDDVTIHKKIIEYCLQAKIFHVVIITKSENLCNQARRNNIHAYYSNALKILKQSENLFLLDPDSAKTLKLPTAKSPDNNNIFNSKKTAYKNFEVRVNRNGERLCSRNFNKNKTHKETSITNFFGCDTEGDNSLENNVFALTSLDSEGFLLEDKLKEFCAKHAYLQNNVNERVDELICSFLQIMEHCLHNILQRIPDTQFDPPCWLYQSLEILKEHYSQNKQLRAVLEHLRAMCGFRLNNGTMRPNIKSDQFIKILGVGILLIEQLEKISQFPELSDCKEMLNKLIADIQTPEEIPAETLLNLEHRRKLQDKHVCTESDESAEDGRCDLLVSNIESAPQHENDSDIAEVFNDSGGSINLLQNSRIINGINCETGPSGIRSEKNTPEKNVTGDPVFQKLENTVDQIRHALKRMKQFIDVRMVELNNGGISERRKECLRERTNIFKECADGMFQTLKMIQKRENPNDADFGKKFAVRNPAYTACIERCLEQVEIMQKAFGYLLIALKQIK